MFLQNLCTNFKTIYNTFHHFHRTTEVGRLGGQLSNLRKQGRQSNTNVLVVLQTHLRLTIEIMEHM